MDDLDTIRHILLRVVHNCDRNILYDIDYTQCLKPHIIREGILTRHQLSELDVESKSNAAKIDLIFDNAHKLSLKSFRKLINAVEKSGFTHVSKELNDGLNREIQKQQASTKPARKTVGSDVAATNHYTTAAVGLPELPEFRFATRMQCTEDVNKNLATDINLATNVALATGDGKYDMSTDPRGIAFIINIENFTYFAKRDGSQKDKERLRDMFQSLGWCVTTEDDLTAQQMKDYLWRLSKLEMLKKTSALAIAILTHGTNNDVYFGADGLISMPGKTPIDGTYIDRYQLMHHFSSSNCVNMRGKPKWFIAQACRGSAEDIINTSSTSHQFHQMETDMPDISSRQTKKMANNRVPENGDMCYLFASSPGFKAYRRKQNGSPFIQVLTETVLDLASTTVFPKIMQTVNKKLYEEKLPQNKITLSEFSSQLIKDWYLNPIQDPSYF